MALINGDRRSAKGDLLSPIQPSLCDNISNKTVTDGMFGLGMAPNEILCRFLNPFNLKIPGNVVIAATDMCGKNPSLESGYMGLHENIHF